MNGEVSLSFFTEQFPSASWGKKAGKGPNQSVVAFSFCSSHNNSIFRSFLRGITQLLRSDVIPLSGKACKGGEETKGRRVRELGTKEKKRFACVLVGFNLSTVMHFPSLSLMLKHKLELNLSFHNWGSRAGPRVCMFQSRNRLWCPSISSLGGKGSGSCQKLESEKSWDAFWTV